MGSKTKSSSSRKPPEPSDSHSEIADWLDSVMPDLQSTVKKLDRMIRDEHSGLQYALKWKKAYYGLPDRGWIIELVAYDVSVNAVFHGGADFDSPPPQGDTGRSRYIKVTSVDEADTAEMKSWIKQAGEVDGWK